MGDDYEQFSYEQYYLKRREEQERLRRFGDGDLPTAAQLGLLHEAARVIRVAVATMPGYHASIPHPDATYFAEALDSTPANVAGAYLTVPDLSELYEKLLAARRQVSGWLAPAYADHRSHTDVQEEPERAAEWWRRQRGIEHSLVGACRAIYTVRSEAGGADTPSDL